MAYNQKLPEWKATGTEPSETQKNTGFQPGMKPPAQWFNWFLNWTYLALQELQEKAAEKAYVDGLAEELREEIGQADIPDASLTVKGKVQLSNKTDGTSQSLAATEKAVSDARQAAITSAATDATTKANAAEANAKTYANTNFRKPSEIMRANLVKNSSGFMGLNYWTNVGAVPFATIANPSVGSFFYVDAAVAAQQYAVLDSESIGVNGGNDYLLQAVFHSAGAASSAIMQIEVTNYATNETINSLQADPNSWWHRKTKVVRIPVGVSAIKLRLVVTNANYSTKAFSRIGFTEAGVDVPYASERDLTALYEQTESAKQSGVDAKNGIVDAINAKGGSASTNDTWAQLADKIRLLSMFKAGDYALKTLDSGGATYNTYPSMGSYFKPSAGGTFRVSYTLFASHDINGASAYAQIYVNGVPRGPQRTVNNNTGGQRFTEDITINTGDAIQLYLWSSNSQNIASASFFTLSSDFNIVTGS